jgi:CheY-like chemotaxis protein
MMISLHGHTWYGARHMVPFDTRALVIDDEPLVLGAIGQALRVAVQHVDEETSARRGIELFTVHRHPVVVVDLMMPEMNGIEVLEQIHRLEPRTRVIIVTGCASKDTAIQALNLSAFRFLEKPVAFKHLQQVVADAWAEYQHGQRQATSAAQELEAKIDLLYEDVWSFAAALERAPDDQQLQSGYDQSFLRLRGAQAVEAEAAARAFSDSIALKQGTGYASMEAARRILDRDKHSA